MKRRKHPFGTCSPALLALPFVLSACAGGVGGEKDAEKSALKVVLGTGVTWSAPQVLVTPATRMDDEVGATSSAYFGIVQAGNRHPSNISAAARYGAAANVRSMSVDGVAMDVRFSPVSIVDHAYDLTQAEKDGLDGLAHSMLNAGRDTPGYAQFGAWEHGSGDDLVPSQALLPALTHGNRGTPGAAVLSLDSATSIGMTAGIEVETSGDFGVITGDIAVTVNVAGASINRAINGAITDIDDDPEPADVRASLNGSTVDNTFNGSMNLTDRADRPTVGSDPFAGQFVATGAQERASGWRGSGAGGIKAIGVDRALQPAMSVPGGGKAALSL